MAEAVLCPRRRRLYQAQLQSTWDFLWELPRPGGPLSNTDQDRVRWAFSDVEIKRLVDALERILAPFVVYGVARDLERLRPSRALFYRQYETSSDHDKADLLAVVLARRDPSPAQPLSGYTIDNGLSSKAAYDRYFDWIIDPTDLVGGDSGVAVFFQRYPLLLHAVKTATEHYQHNIKLAVDRICADWADICAAFLPSGATDPRLVSIQTTGNDFHKGGKQVLILTFGHSAGQTKVVYKPSAVEIDCRVVGDSGVFKTVHPQGPLDKDAYVQDRSLTEILNASTIQTTDVGFTRRPLPTYGILPYNRESVPDAYGYLEFLTREPVIKLDTAAADDANVAMGVVTALRGLGRQNLLKSDWVFMDTNATRSYYHQMGKLMAMALTFSLCDLHVQNLIVHGGQPHLIDVEEALKKPMTKVSETYLIGSGISPTGGVSDPDSPELVIEHDLTSDMFFDRWKGLTRSPATSALYLWLDDVDRPEPAVLDPPPAVTATGTARRPGLSAEQWRAALHRNALLLGFEEALDALAGPVGNAAAQSWVRSVSSTSARYVTRATKDYASDFRGFYWFCSEADVEALGASGRAPDAWYGRVFMRSDPAKAFLVGYARAQRKAWSDPKSDPHWRPPFFALEHPDHVWYDYFNGDIPAFYHVLGDRELLNSQGASVAVGSAVRWQDSYLPGVGPVPDNWKKDNDWPASVEPLYLPLTSVDIVLAQLQRLSERWAKGVAERGTLVREAFAETTLVPSVKPVPKVTRVGGGQ